MPFDHNININRCIQSSLNPPTYNVYPLRPNLYGLAGVNIIGYGTILLYLLFIPLQFHRIFLNYLNNNILESQDTVNVRAVDQAFRTVNEGEIWCFCTVTFEQKGSKLNHNLWLYSKYQISPSKTVWKSLGVLLTKMFPCSQLYGIEESNWEFRKESGPIVIQLAMSIPLHKDPDDSQPKHCKRRLLTKSPCVHARWLTPSTWSNKQFKQDYLG